MSAGELLFAKPVSPLTNVSEKVALTDSLKIFSERIRSRESWEKVVSFPGNLALFPLKIFLKSTKETVGYVVETNLIPKTYDFFIADDGSKGALPTYSSRTGVGMKYFHVGLLAPGSVSTLTATAGLRGRQRYELNTSNIKRSGGSASIEFMVRYQLEEGITYLILGRDPWLKAGAIYTVPELNLTNLLSIVQKAKNDNNSIVRETAQLVLKKM